MSDQLNGKTKGEVIPLDRERRAARSKDRVGDKSAKRLEGAAAYERALNAQRASRGGSPQTKVRWIHYVQVVILLFLAALLMRSCQASGV